jgi:putative aldouronate transport system permease protein
VKHRTFGELLFSWVNFWLLLIVGLITIYPFVYTIFVSLSVTWGFEHQGQRIFTWIPTDATLTSYKMVFENPEMWMGYGNTLFRTIVGTALSLFFTCLAAYPLAQPHMPGRRSLSFFIIFTMIFTGGMVPMFLLINGIGLYNNRLVYILPILLTAFNIIVVKNFLMAIPRSLHEAAVVDGASEWRILFQIYIPLSKPVLATVLLWTAVIHWNMWFDAMIYVDDNSKQVMQTFLQRVVKENNTEMIEKGLATLDPTSYSNESLEAATVMVTVLPILLLYPFVQRYFVKGIVLGAVKE